MAESKVNRTRPIYLDHHSTTPVDPRVVEAMLPYFTLDYGNASSASHEFGQRAADAVEEARRKVADLVQTDPRNIVFTSGATEANNLAIKGAMHAARAGRHLIVNAAEHRAVLDPARRLSRKGFDVTTLAVTSAGTVDVDVIADAMRDETVLVSMMFASNEVGSINPVADVAALCEERQVLFHCDAVQAIGTVRVDLSNLPIDLLSLSAHKIYGPKGIGALVVRRRPRRPALEPLLDGGGQEQGLRCGTLAVPLIVGFGAACGILAAERESEQQRISGLRDRLAAGLRRRIPDLIVNGDQENRIVSNLNVGIPDIDGDALLAGLDGLAVSSGSACTSSNPEPSHVLTAMGVNETLARASLRFGIGRFNTSDEIDAAVDIVCSTVGRLRT